MKIGDLVQYRWWREGDDKIEDVPAERRGWGERGIIVAIEAWKVGKENFPKEGILFLNSCGQFIEAWRGDLYVINENENKGNGSRFSTDWSVSYSSSTYKL